MSVLPLTTRLAELRSGAQAPDTLAGVGPADRRDHFLALLDVYDLSLAPLHTVGDAARFVGHPAVVALKADLERDWLSELSAVPPPAGLPADAAAVMRVLATRDRLPAVYRWLARDASWPQVLRFLAVEGGPDGGFDDLVALCQIGLSGTAKLELGHNFWDELGDGALDAVHTTLYERMVEAVGMPRVPRTELPVEALERTALGGLLATNRWLQPEMVGALGMVELQAGPRCRLVLRAFERLGAPRGAYPFYQVHAEVDPRHGRDWLELAVSPLAAAHPEWGPRMVRGAWWRSRAGDALFTRLYRDLARGATAA